MPHVEGQPGLRHEMRAPLHSLKNKSKKSVSTPVPVGEILRKRPTDGMTRFLKTTGRHPVKLEFQVKHISM